MRKHHFIEISKMMILHNIGKEKEILKMMNTLERNKMDNQWMGIVN